MHRGVYSLEETYIFTKFYTRACFIQYSIIKIFQREICALIIAVYKI